MLTAGLQPAYKPPKVNSPDDASILTLMNALVVRANDLYSITTAAKDKIIPSIRLLSEHVTRKNIAQYINSLNYIADVIEAKLAALPAQGE